jgi:hypothetical protein
MTETKKMSLMKKVLIGFVVLIILSAIGSMIEDKAEPLFEASNKQESASVNEPTKVQPSWEYGTEKDKMSGQEMFFNSTTSTNELEFEFPYHGGSSFRLTVRNMGKENEILLTVSKGQFMPSIMNSDNVRIKFDEEAPMDISYNSADDASADVIFLTSVSKIISKLKTSKKLMIEAPFYDAGRQIILFNVEGFTWDK